MQKFSHRTYSFDGFTLDLTRGCLLQGAEEIKLAPKPFEALKYLVENPCRLISKSELIQIIWPDTAVTDDSLVQCLREVRRALGGDSQKIIRTVPRRGYIFDRAVESTSPITTYTEDTGGDETFTTASSSSPAEPISRTQAVSAPTTIERQTTNRQRRTILMAAVMGVCLVTLVFLIGYTLRMRKSHKSSAFSAIRFTSLTSTGNTYIPVISPDGKYLAYCSLESEGAGLRVEQVATKSVLQLVPPAAVQYWGISWSRDGAYIYYVIGSNGPGNLYRVPALGGHSEKLSEGGGAVISKDGQRLAYQRVTPSNRHEMVITDADAKNEYVIPSIAQRNLDIRAGDWSPDGKSFACVIRDRSVDGSTWRISEFPIEGDGESVILPPRKTQIIMLIWLADNSGLVMSAIDQETHVGQLYFISYPSGVEYRLTHDLTEYGIISSTADSRMIVAQSRQSFSQLWIAPIDDFNRGRVLATTNNLAYHYLSWTPDNHLVFDVEAGGTIDIWRMLTDGKGREQLTHQQGQNREPAATPDGRYVIFVSTRSGSSQVWRMDADGNNPKQLTSFSEGVAEPQGASDGGSVLYTKELQGRTRLLRTPVDGGEAREVIDNSVEFWALSPDGSLLAYSYRDQEAKTARVAVVPVAGGAPLARFDFDPSYLMRWTQDGSGLMYIAPDDSLWIQRISGGPPKQLTHFQQDLQLVSFASSPNGRQIVYARGRNNYDAVALTMK